jgi:SPP1 family predicted phage head-tail adaptor
MPISAGKLNRLMVFQRRDDTRNEFNELVGTWVEFARARGEMRALNAREFFAALQAQSERSYRLVCRWSSVLATVRTSDRAVIDGQVHDIQSAQDPTGRRRELEFVVVEHDEATV